MHSSGDDGLRFCRRSQRLRSLVVVLGDIGRSPRMCNHAVSLATQLNHEVYVIGYNDTIPHPFVSENDHIQIVPLPAPPLLSENIPETLSLLFKFTWTFFVLLYALLFRAPWSVHLVLLQNPPGIPTMLVCWMVSRLKSAKFVIDWHNYTYSMLQHKWHLEKFDSFRPPPEENGEVVAKEPVDAKRRIPKEERDAAFAREKRRSNKVEKKTRKSLRQRFLEWTYAYEGWFGRRADACLCVSRAMRADLSEAWNVPAAVFYDRPPQYKFKQFPLEELHLLFIDLGETEGLEIFNGSAPDYDCEQFTRFTALDANGKAHYRDDRPFLLVSSTSWTPDEDFGILLDALVKYDRAASSGLSSLPSLVCAVTGRGEEKAMYMEKIAKLSLSTVHIVTPWLEPEDYPRLLAAADVGVSLHTSTSGLDLPMKVVDMLGAGTPVLAKKYPCIGELVSEGINGRTFDTAHELTQQIRSLASGHPLNNKGLHELQNNVRQDPLLSWEETWDSVVAPIAAVDEHLERSLARE